MKRVEYCAASLQFQCNEKMARKIETECSPALGSGDMDVKNPKGDRKSFSSLDDAQEVGVLQIVIGLIVTAIPIFSGDDSRQYAGGRFC